MELGLIGLGRMGGNMAQRLVRGGHRVVGYDPNPQARNRNEAEGVSTTSSLELLVAGLPTPRALWMMVPAGDITESNVQASLRLLAADDTLIDGGNSNYQDTLRRGKTLAERGIHYIDCGTSGGIWGLEQGYSLTLGGDAAVIEHLRPIFSTLAPAADHGWGRVGPGGSGHFTKMIHNGIEYGLMQSYAEGFSILRHKREFQLDLHQVAEIWRHGSVVRSWLLELISHALEQSPTLAGIAPYVEDSGEGRWAVAEAIKLNVPAPIITQALIERLQSRNAEAFSAKLLAAMRNQFGGHKMRSE